MEEEKVSGHQSLRNLGDIMSRSDDCRGEERRTTPAVKARETVACMMICVVLDF